jgi:hypothetical protein
MTVKCDVQINLLRMVECSGDFVTTTLETCMTLCPDRLYYPVSMLTLTLLPLSRLNASVSDALSCFLYYSFDVDSYLV